MNGDGGSAGLPGAPSRPAPGLPSLPAARGKPGALRSDLPAAVEWRPRLPPFPLGRVARPGAAVYPGAPALGCGSSRIQPPITWLAKTLDATTCCLVGNDHVWPRKTNEQARKYIGGPAAGAEYVPPGAPNKRHPHQGEKARLVVITPVGGDNIDFNRTFAGFGRDRSGSP